MDDITITELVRRNEENYIDGTTTISKYVDWSLYENIEKIDAYLNSKHISGDTDSLGREKPFFNIVTAATNVWYRATDIDRKNIRIKPTKLQDTIGAFLATVHLQSWMRKQNFGQFLNDWGRTLSRYGSAVTKFIEKDGELYATVIPWNRLIIDAVDMNNDVVIEVLEMTPAQLKKHKGYDQKVVDKLLDTVSVRQTMGGQNKDNKTGYIKLYEVHGEMPLSYITGRDDDDDTYVQQMHVVSFVESKEKGEYDDFCLISGKEKKNPYMITHLIKEDGRTMAIGAVEHLFEAQWMMNHTVKSIKDQLDLASKLIYQTSDGNFIGQNALSAIENGDILIHNVNEPLTQINNNSHDITSLQNFGQQWKTLGNEITGVSESMLGNNAPSGTAWRQTEALLQESHSLFELMTENKGLDLENMMREYIIPFIKTKMDTKDEVAATLGDYDVARIEGMYIKNEAIRRANTTIKEQILSGQIANPQDMQALEQDVKGELAQHGNQRFFKPSEIDDKTWKEVFKDLEWDVEVEITGESSDKQAVMTTLNTMLATLSRLQGRPMSPEEKFVFNKILTEAGSVSPIELSQLEAEKPQQDPQTLQASPNGGVVGQPMPEALPVSQ